MAITATAQETLSERYRRIRSFSDTITDVLSAEDCMVQSMPDVSPTRWHLAHTTWFFETFVLAEQPGYEPFDEHFKYLFNSYYNTVGKQFPRPQRGLISRPGLSRIQAYRAAIDDQIEVWLESSDVPDHVLQAVEVGLHHEQQHQELMLTDIKHVLSCNPMLPAYHEFPFESPNAEPAGWTDFGAGTQEFGHQGKGFCFDNELPCHTEYLQMARVSTRLVTCGEFLEFMEAGGYQTPQLWLSLGWSTVQDEEWDAPLYWVQQDGQWMHFTMAGLVPVNHDWPVCHVSFFEADAYARWRGQRLPTEFEWEYVARSLPHEGQFANQLLHDQKALHPTRAGGISGGSFGGVWEWTSSPYTAYPGYQPLSGALGEYNGKFMCNQYVLRGGSVATSADHIRSTYRNFFPPSSRWQFSGFRIASSSAR